MKRLWTRLRPWPRAAVLCPYNSPRFGAERCRVKGRHFHQGGPRAYRGINIELRSAEGGLPF